MRTQRIEGLCGRGEGTKVVGVAVFSCRKVHGRGRPAGLERRRSLVRGLLEGSEDGRVGGEIRGSMFRQLESGKGRDGSSLSFRDVFLDLSWKGCKALEG